MSNLRLSPRRPSVTVIAMLLACGLRFVPSCAADETPAATEPAVAEMRLTTPKLPADLESVARELNQRFSAGVDPAENGAVYLVRLLGPEVFDAELRDDSLAMLGIEALGNDAPRFVYIEQYAAELAPQDLDQRRRLAEQLTREFQTAYGSVWKASEHPTLAKYLDRNDAALDELVRITKMPRYYAPIITAADPPSLISASYSIERRLTYLGQCLTIRALRRFDEGNFAGTVRDLIACHQLANMLAKGSPLDVSIAKAHWIDAYAFQAEWTLLASGQLTAEQAQQLRQQLQSLAPVAPSHTAADVGERLILRQEIELLKDYDDALYAFFDWAPEEHAAQLKAVRDADIDWDQAQQRADEIQDQTVETLLISDRQRQDAEINRLNEELARWRQRTDAEETTLLESLKSDRGAGSRWVGEAIALALRTNIWQRICTDRRGQVRRDLISVGLGLEEYHRRHGFYPEQLADLSPEILASVPNDAHSAAPFAYRRPQPQQAELISWGTNQQNDAGLFFQDDTIIKLGRR